MKRLVLTAALLLAACGAARAEVVRPAPDFQIADMGRSLRSFRGQAVVLVIAGSARDKQFRTEVRRLKEVFPQMSNEKVLFVAALLNGPGQVRSDIPFMIAANPRQVAADYGFAGRCAIAVIGVDGNLDMITSRLIAGQRVRDIVFNNFESQAESRKPLGQ